MKSNIMLVLMMCLTMGGSNISNRKLSFDDIAKSSSFNQDVLSHNPVNNDLINDTSKKMLGLPAINEKDSWFKYYELPIKSTLISDEYSRYGATLSVDFDPDKRNAAIESCKNSLPLEIPLHLGISKRGRDEGCDLFAYEVGVEIQFSAFGSIVLPSSFKNDFWMLGVIEIGDKYVNDRIFFDSCSTSNTDDHWGLNCVRADFEGPIMNLNEGILIKHLTPEIARKINTSDFGPEDFIEQCMSGNRRSFCLYQDDDGLLVQSFHKPPRIYSKIMESGLQISAESKEAVQQALQN